MFITIDGIKIFYQRYYGDGLPVLLLHGWGGSSKTMDSLFDCLIKEGRNVISLDFPGFGYSDAPPPEYGVYEYALLVERFVNELSIDRLVFAGHSFGGRVAILIAANTSLADSIVLIDSAGLKPKRKLSYYIRVYRYKLAKLRGRSVREFGSDDYKALSGDMRTVFTRVVNQHLDDELRKITCPVLIMWGERDMDTPIYMARKFNRRIKDSGIVFFKGCGHYPYLDDAGRFNLVFKEFIRSRKNA